MDFNLDYWSPLKEKKLEDITQEMMPQGEAVSQLGPKKRKDRTSPSGVRHRGKP